MPIVVRLYRSQGVPSLWKGFGSSLIIRYNLYEINSHNLELLISVAGRGQKSFQAFTVFFRVFETPLPFILH